MMGRKMNEEMIQQVKDDFKNGLFYDDGYGGKTGLTEWDKEKLYMFVRKIVTDGKAEIQATRYNELCWLFGKISGEDAVYPVVSIDRIEDGKLVCFDSPYLYRLTFRKIDGGAEGSRI